MTLEFLSVTQKGKIKAGFYFLCFLLILLVGESYPQINVKNFGAVGDGKTLDTQSIQNTIDKAARDGGGIVNVPAGIYKVGTLILKDNVDLHLQSGAELLGSSNIDDYTKVSQKFESRTNVLYAKYFMIFAEGVKNISVTGPGIINGSGLKNFTVSHPQNLRPFLMRLVSCDNVAIQDVHLLESANWTLHLLGCKDVNINGIVIENSADANRDGLDIDCCQRVTVSNSRFSTGDDAIVMKSTGEVLCQDIAITNCIIRTRASAIKTGTESNGGFKNITVSNCIIKDIPVHAGIELMTVDGGIMQNILLENIAMENVATPFFIRIGIRARPYKLGQYVKEIGDVKDIQLNNISVVDAKLPSSIMGLHDRKIQNISINNYTVRYSATQKGLPFNAVPFEEFSYPAARVFKNLPAYGLYCRNIKGLYLQNFNMYSVKDEKRPALAFDRVDDLKLLGVQAEIEDEKMPMAHFRNTQNVFAAYCQTIGFSKSLFESEKKTCGTFNFLNNYLQENQKELVKVKDLPDEKKFDDFETNYKFSVEHGEEIKGIEAQNLGLEPLNFEFEMINKGNPQICLLILNNSKIPERVLIKYDGITQEFLVDWSEWGWAPISLIKEFKTTRRVSFEIYTQNENSGLKLAKVYIRYQNLGYTD